MKRLTPTLFSAAAAAMLLLGSLLQPLPAVCRSVAESPAAQADSTETGARSEWLPLFTAVVVDAPVDIRFVEVPDTEAPKIVYDTKGSYTTKFRAEVRDKVLRISERRDARRAERTTVTVCYNALERVSIMEASATFDGPLKATLLDLTVGEGAHLTAALEVQDLQMELTGPSEAELSGGARYLSLFISTGKVEASTLESMSVRVNATSSGHASLWVTDRFEAKTSTGGTIAYKGDPTILITGEKFMGGSISRLGEE